MTLRTAFLWTLIISLSGAALLGIMVIIFPDLLPADDKILVTALLIGLYSLPALACAIVLGRGRLIPAMWVGIVASPLAWAIWLPLILGNPWRWRGDWDVWLVKGGFTLSIVACWSAHLGLLSLLRLDRPWFRRARLTTLAIAGAVGVLSIFALWFEFDEEWFARMLAVLAILLSAGTIITPIFALIDLLHRRATHESVPSQLRVHLVCPRCRHGQDLAVGAQRCAKCQLRIEINVEEPRCACGYLLYQLTGDRCPECGRRLEDADQWRAPAADEVEVATDSGQNIELSAS